MQKKKKKIGHFCPHHAKGGEGLLHTSKQVAIAGDRFLCSSDTEPEANVKL